MITSFYDQVLLQKDLEFISEWGILNRLTVNCDKCKVITFNRSAKNLLQYSYTECFVDDAAVRTFALS